MKLSELKPESVKVIESPGKSGPLKLSDLKGEEIKLLEQTKQYEKPIGPEQAGAVDQFVERVQDPERWKAFVGKGLYKNDVVQGDAPMVMPGGALPKLTKAATALAEGKGVAYALGRTGLSAGQGAAMNAVGGPEGESMSQKWDRMKSGAKLSGGIQAVAESLPVVGKMAGALTKKIGSAISGVDESLIKNYADRTDEVNNLIKQSNGDMTVAADQVRSELAAGIQSTKQKLNAQISQTLKEASPEANVSIEPIIKALENAKAKLNPNFKSGAIAEIEEMIAAIGKEAKEGKVNVSSLYQIKQYLNEGSASAYNKGGQIFTRAGEAARAAKDAANEARSALEPVAGAISQADRQLSKLHSLERRMNKNLLQAGKPEAALLAAGSGANPRNAATLRELERFAGVPASQRAKDLATARTFANPSLTPADFTGKAAARVLAAGGIGAAVAGPVGAAVGSAVASPMAVKIGVNAANVAGRAARATKIPGALDAVRRNPVATTAVTQVAANHLRQQNAPKEHDGAPVLGEREQDRAPAKGEAAWLNRGAERLGLSSEQIERLSRDKKTRELILQASDLKPGSPQLGRLIEQLKKGGAYK